MKEDGQGLVMLENRTQIQMTKWKMQDKPVLVELRYVNNFKKPQV